MIRASALIALLLSTGSVSADIVVAAHTVRVNSIIGAGDVKLVPGEARGVFSDPGLVIGQEARVTLFRGRPLRMGDVGPPALIERNQIVLLEFIGAGVSIRTDARALDRAGAGDRIRVMNLASRNTVVGEVTPRGTVLIKGASR